MTKEIAILGDNQVFIKRDKEGFIKAINCKVKLSEREGHLATIKGKTMITGAGFYQINRVVGASIITPQHLTLPDGTKVVNPYIVLDEGGSIKKVWVKKTVVGYGPAGNLAISSSTLVYDVDVYFTEDILGKLAYDKTIGRLCAKEQVTEKEKKEGMFFSIDGMMGVWIDFNHKDVIKSISTYVQNKKFAERKAQTIAERNAMKKHPAFGSFYVTPIAEDGDTIARINTVSWTHDLNQEDIEKIAELGADGNKVNYKGKKIETIDSQDDISREDLETELEEDESREKKEVVIDLEPTKEEPPDKLKLADNIIMGVKIIGDKAFEDIKSKLKINGKLDMLNAKQLQLVLNMINEEVDKQTIEGEINND